MAAAAIDSPAVINHLLIGKHGLGDKNAKVTLGPQIAPPQIQNYDHEEKKHNRTHINVKPNVTKTPKSFNGQRTPKQTTKLSPAEVHETSWMQPPTKDRSVAGRGGQQGEKESSLEQEKNWPPPSKDQLVLAERGHDFSGDQKRNTTRKGNQKHGKERKKASSAKDWEDIDLSESDSDSNAPDLIDFGDRRRRDDSRRVQRLLSEKGPSLEGAIVHPEIDDSQRNSSRDGESATPSSVANSFADSPELRQDRISSISEIEEEGGKRTVSELTTEFNFAFEAFKPETPKATESLAPSLENGHCVGSKKPWLVKSSNCDPNHEPSSQHLAMHSGRLRSSSSVSTDSHSPTTPTSEVFNPFPVRKLKSNEESMKRKAKLGLLHVN